MKPSDRAIAEAFREWVAQFAQEGGTADTRRILARARELDRAATLDAGDKVWVGVSVLDGHVGVAVRVRGVMVYNEKHPLPPAPAGDAEETRACTCHPDDNPPRPCPRKFALNECRAAHAGDAVAGLVGKWRAEAKDWREAAEIVPARNRSNWLSAADAKEADADELAAALQSSGREGMVNAPPAADASMVSERVERAAAEQAYTMQAFDYATAPVGSRDWTLYWRGWWGRVLHGIAPSAADRMVVVPREPTEAMQSAGLDAFCNSPGIYKDADEPEIFADVYRAMLAAAPRQDGAEGVDRG
jgi:hypothetical protein